MGCTRLSNLLLVLCGLLATAAAGRNGMPDPSAHQPIALGSSLLDSYIQLSSPKVSVAAQQSGRAGRTTLTVAIPSSSANQFMPVVSPEAQGTTFDVLKTWDALKAMASAFRKADVLNQLNPDSPPLFPKGSQAIRPASVSLPVEASTSSLAAEELKLSSLVAFPPNLMVFPFGQSTAAIADVLDVAYDEASATVTMQLDVVHNPVVFSQFLEHTPSSADTTEAHYHFATRPGLDVDAPALLQALKDSSYQVEARLPVGESLNVTIVGDNSCGGSFPLGSVQLTITGPGTITSASQSGNGGRRSTAKRRRQLEIAYLTEGQGWFVVQADGVGEIEVATQTFSKALTNEASINITTFVAVPPVSKLLLSPTKAYRRCHDPSSSSDPVTITALALDANHVPVPNANISFAVFGDCAPEYTTSGLTDATGKTQVTVISREPGAVAIVAATQGTGGTVLSHPSHIIFFADHAYVDRREHEYYRGRQDEYYAHHGKHWGDDDFSDDDDGDTRHGSRDGPDGRDAWHYERAAAKLAAERALGAPVSSNLQA